MSLATKLAELIERVPEARVVLPTFAVTRAFPIEWLDHDASDAWDGYPELDDVADELADYIPLADIEVGDDEHRVLVIAREEPHAAFVFDDGFQLVAASIDELIATTLLAPGQSTPAAALAAACDIATARLDAHDPAGAIAALTPIVSSHPRAPAPDRLERLADALAAAWTTLAAAHHQAGDDTAAIATYEIAGAWGSEPARSSLATMAIAAGRWDAARSALEGLLATWKPPDELTALRIGYAHVLAELGEVVALTALGTKHADYLRWLAGSDRAKAEVLRNELLVALDRLVDQHPALAEALAAVRAAVAEPLPAPAPGAGASEADIATAVRLVKATKAMQLRSLIANAPGVLDAPAVRAAVADLPDSPRATEIRKLATKPR